MSGILKAGVLALLASAGLSAGAASSPKTAFTFDCLVLDSEGHLAGIGELKTSQATKAGTVKTTGSLTYTGKTCTHSSDYSWSGKKTVSGNLYSGLGISCEKSCVEVLEGLFGSLTVKNVGKLEVVESWGFDSGEGMIYATLGDLQVEACVRPATQPSFFSRFAGKSYVYEIGSEDSDGSFARMWLEFDKKAVTVKATLQFNGKTATTTVRPVCSQLPVSGLKVTAGDAYAELNALFELDCEIPELISCTGMGGTTLKCADGLWCNAELAAISSRKVSSPVFLDAGAEDAVLGVAFKRIVELKASGYPAKFSATGLPSGLKINADTGEIAGVPTKAGTFKATIKATSKANSSWKSSIKKTFRVQALPAWAQGSFGGYVDLDGYFCPFTMNVTSAGKVSGKIVRNGKSYSFSASSLDGLCDGEAYVAAKMKYGKTPLVVSMYYRPDGSYLPEMDGDVSWEASAAGEIVSEHTGAFPVVSGAIDIWTEDMCSIPVWGCGGFWQAGYASKDYHWNKPSSCSGKMTDGKVTLTLKMGTDGMVTATGTIRGKSVSTTAPVVPCDLYNPACRAICAAGTGTWGWAYLIFPASKGFSGAVVWTQIDFWMSSGKSKKWNMEPCVLWDVTGAFVGQCDLAE